MILRIVKKIFILISLFSLTFMAIILYNQESIVHPQRRNLQAYHYEWLTHSSQHSMKIIKDENYKDILIVKRDIGHSLSKRSQKILGELQRHGYNEKSLTQGGTIVMFHGKNGRKEDLLPVAERYVTAGFTVVLVDLPAHGESLQGSTNYGSDFDYRRLLSMMEKHVDTVNQPIYFWGMSLGGRYAITTLHKYAKEHLIQPKALILVSTFDNLSSILEEKSSNLFGKFMGNLLYRSLAYSLNFFYEFDPQKIESVSLAKNIMVPIFMLHGKEDRLIDYRHGEKLFEAFPNAKKVLHLDKNGNHHNILVTDYPFYLESILFLLNEG